ncbi:MAG: FAD-dependent oxidoreductase, partial [Deltaproteobacteria bacterium]|nr:FAD-dependent oxidoreductase [Deltaproteobacteria bacterium]
MKPILVIGAGPAGLEAAKGAADLGQKVVLVEMRDKVGGNPIHNSYSVFTPHQIDAETAMAELIHPVKNHKNIELKLSTQVVSVEGDAPNLKVTLKGPQGEETLDAGAAIVATGFEHFDPGRETQVYGYYEYDDVITLLDAEKMLKAKKFQRVSDGKPPKNVCFIQCVGSRDRQIGNQWCSKVCCGIASQQAIEIKELLPQAKVFVFYIDLRAYGFWEDMVYWKAQEEKKVNFIRGIVTEITMRGDQLVVKGEDTTLGRPMEVPMDMVILSVGMEPSPGTREMSKLFKLPLEGHGWLATQGQSPLNTVVTQRPGVFVAGAATGPADLEDAVSRGSSAALKAVTFVG